MKHSRLYSCVIALAMLFVANLGAMAQEYVLKSISFLTPGEKGVLAVSMTNPDPVNAFEGRIVLPEGLTFVDADREEYCKVGKTERTSKFSIGMQKKNDRNAFFLGYSTVNAYVQPGQGEVFTFEVNVSENFTATSEIELSDGAISIVDKNIVKTPVVKGKVGNVADQIIATSNEVKVTEGTPATVTLSCDFQKEFMSFLSFTIQLPEGLSIVKGSEKADLERCPNHVATILNNLYNVKVVDIFGNLNFLKKDGKLCSFEVVADDKFVDGSEIILKGINGVAKINKVNTAFYAEDLHIKVTKAGTATGINGIESDFAAKADGIYTISGLKVNQLVKGVNIVVKDGKATKVVKK